MSTIVTRAGKGAPLTHNEVDANFTNLNTDKYQAGDDISVGTITVTGTVDGRDVAADGTKLDGIEAGATADQTASEILTAIKNVDGASSGLDADLLDGNHATAFATAAQGALADSALQAGDNISSLTNDAGYTANIGDITGVTAGSGLTGGGTSGSVTVSHADTSTQASVNNSGATVIQDVTLDTYGHVTALGSVAVTPALIGASATSHNHTLDSLSNVTVTSNTSGEILKWNGSAWINNTLAEAGIQPAGSYLTGNQTITLSGDLTGSGTTSINAQIAANVVGANELNVTGNGTTAQYLRSDGDGSFTWATPTDTNTTYSAGSGIGLSGTTFSVAAGGGLTQDASGLSHADTSSQASLTALTGANVISDIDVDGYGHVTSMATRAMTAADLGALTANQTITLSGDLSGSGTTSINAQIAANVVTANELAVTGNGTTAQYLRSDGDGTFTWATPTDTNTTYSAGSGLSLVGTTFSHSDTSAQASVDNSGATVIQDVTLDTYGHVTALGSVALTASTVGAMSATNPVISSGTITEDVYAISGTSVALEPDNGSVQTHTLTGNTTYTDAFSSGQAITLMIDDGTAYTITWPTMTWANNGGSAPTLATSGYTVIALWKVSTTLYGALVGDGS